MQHKNILNAVHQQPVHQPEVCPSQCDKNLENQYMRNEPNKQRKITNQHLCCSSLALKLRNSVFTQYLMYFMCQQEHCFDFFAPPMLDFSQLQTYANNIEI